MSKPINCSDSELCTFLAALGEGYYPICYSGTNPSAPSKSSPTASKFLRLGNAIVCFLGSQSLETSGSSMESRGEELSMQSTLESHASECQHPDADSDSWTKITMRPLSESFARLGRNTFSWKTPPDLLGEDYMEFSGTWPLWGMMQNGECWELMPLDFPITEPDCGWLPTPQAGDARATINRDSQNQRMLSHAVQSKIGNGEKLNPAFAEMVMDWPIGWTDCTQSGTGRFRSWRQQHGGF